MNELEKLLSNKAYIDSIASKVAQINKADTFDQSTGLVWFDLSPIVQLMFPFKQLIPLISKLPRVKGNGGTGHNWKRITGINVNNVSVGVSEGNRGGGINVTLQSQSANYKTLGLEGNAFVGSSPANIWVMNANGSGRKVLTPHYRFASIERADSEPDWSPNGTEIAFTRSRQTTGLHGAPEPVTEIDVMNADGSSQTRLTRTTKNDHSPTWSPDWKKIAFVRDRILTQDSRQHTLSVRRGSG